MSLIFRTAQVERADAKAMTLDISFASAAPVVRRDHVEVLDIARLDVTRLNQQAPLLRNHDPNQVVGRVVPGTAKVSGDKARARIEFSPTQQGRDAFAEAQAGCWGISFGYAVGSCEVTGRDQVSGLEVRICEVCAYEISLAAVPADASVGVGRSSPASAMAPNQPQHSIEITRMNNEPPAGNTPANTSAERARSSEILAIADRFKVPIADAQRFIAEGGTVDDFRKHVMESRGTPRPVIPASPAFAMHVTRSGYSLARALASRLDGGRLDGIEAEADQELTRLNGRGKGFWIPHAAFATRSLSAGTATAGGFTIQNEVMNSEIINVFRPASKVLALGARTMNGLGADGTIPRITTGATATWRSEKAQAGQSEPAFGQVGLTKKRLTVYAEITRELMMGNPDAENLVRNDLIAAIGEGIDTGALIGSGASGEPLGVVNTTGVNTVTFGAAPTWAKVLSFKTAIANDNADVEGARFGWVASPGVEEKWRSTPKVTGYPVFLMDDAMAAAGYKFAGTTKITGNKVIFGDWSELVIAFFGGGVDIVVDPYTKAREATICLTLQQWADVVVRHPESFCVSTDSGAQ